MNNQVLIEFLKNTGMVLLGGVCLYIQCSKSIQKCLKNIQEQAGSFIKEAEELYTDVKQGGTRMQWVVLELHAYVPNVLKNIITTEMIQDIVQNLFEEMEEFAKLQLDKFGEDKK